MNTCRLLVSATFVFSGIVKLIDPVGMQYKVEDYFVAMGLSVPPASIWPLLLGIALSLVEFLLGIYLLFGIRRRLTSWGLLIFMVFYTPLTLWLALTNGVSDCGCFGDAVHLTNWQTFWKNVALLAMVVVVWWRGQLMTRFISESIQWIISLYSLFFGLLVAGYALLVEPMIDFRPYYEGQHIPTAMQWPDDPEALPEILDFDIDPEILEDTSYSFLLISPHLELADDGNMDHINAAFDYAMKHDYRFLALTASDEEAIRRWQDLTGAEYPFAFMDELTLKTIARSNPALVLLHQGTIIAKWPAALIPDDEFPQEPLREIAPDPEEPNSRLEDLLYLLILYALPLLALTLIDRFVFSLIWWRKKHKTAKNN